MSTLKRGEKREQKIEKRVKKKKLPQIKLLQKR